MDLHGKSPGIQRGCLAPDGVQFRENCQPSDLPETRRPRFGEELNAEKMKKAIWLRPEAVAQIEFLE